MKYIKLKEKGSIWLAAQEMIDEANCRQEPVGGLFTSCVSITAKPGDNPKDIVDQFFAVSNMFTTRLKNKTWRVVAPSGDNIWRMAQEMIDRANYYQEEVVCKYNDVEVTVYPGDDIEYVVGQYFTSERITEGKPVKGDPKESDPNIIEVNRLVAKYLKQKKQK